ncbi:MAG: vanadium-dependent haloperoxidase [Bdellovibrionales bacterium]|nr:vanadium-dependent haloperoxidase [Bdellovibrionales bacterium]
MKKQKKNKQEDSVLPKQLNRRQFLEKLGISAAAGISLLSPGKARADNFRFNEASRARKGDRLHSRAAARAYRSANVKHPNNGEEDDFPYLFNYTKSLPHDSTTGEVVPRAYDRYIAALKKNNFDALENIGTGFRPLENPQAGLALPISGMDHQRYKMPPAPRVDKAQHSAEMIELYWQALCRDINFTDFDDDVTVNEAASELSSLSGYAGPRINSSVSPACVFRGNFFGDLSGPFVSQFLLQDISFGAHTIVQRLTRAYPSGTDYMTDFDDWLFIQQGNNFKNDPDYDSTPRYIRNGRDLASYVYEDELYQAYLNAAAWLLEEEAILDSGNPYHRLAATSNYVNFGPKRILCSVSDVSMLALQAVFFQKWFVHRRQRPEEFGGRIHQHITGARDYSMIHDDVLNSEAVAKVFTNNGSYLLPQVYRQGSPTHPAYGAGHATVAGACVTVLKAFFDETYIVKNPVVANSDGTALVPYTGADKNSLTVGGELNKLAANIAIGRNWAGIHWRTDYTESMELGEKIAIQMLRTQAMQYPERHSFSFTRFNGSPITIRGRGFK